ncbi:hypothetical protein [Sphingomonas cavernae]|uniref:Uncharacterized protein n=1 Tax=Sphingomonas cavernae TaxID=2320861 RepID=A0A418WKW7_9SPHN|nr:hypothetical protein [Sphingomonas cavernae]RJF90655.1 hypothetical protein D3876_10595 [Sphingomonas cavernae]
MSPLQQAKLFIVMHFDLAKDALHIYVGLAVFFSVAAIFRVSLKDWRPLLAVLIVALAGELWDIVDTLGEGRSPEWSANWKDVWNTMFWPAAIMLIARHTRLLKR